MSLKLRISKADFDTLADGMKEQYKADGANADEYLLDVDGLDDPAELRRANERNKQLAKDEKKRADDLQALIDSKEDDKSKRRGDIDTLEKSWKEKNDKIAKDKDDVIKRKDTQLRKLLVESVASTLAAELSDAPAVLRPHILSRLDVNFDADEPSTRVLDAKGQPSALTVAELKKEFVDNKDFAPIIRASKASGSGASGNQGGGATKPFKEMNTAERLELHKRDPVGFKRESDALKAAAKT